MLETFLTQVFHLSKEDKKTLQQKVMKLTEELGELAEAVLSNTEAHGCSYKGKTKLDIIEEIGDVVTVALSLLSLVYDNKLSKDALEGVEECWLRKLKKWERKIGATGNIISARILSHDSGTHNKKGKLTEDYEGDASSIPNCEKLEESRFGQVKCWFDETHCESCPRALK